MAEKFGKSDSRCGGCGDVPKDGSHLSYNVKTRMHLCDTCRQSGSFTILDCPSSYQKSRMCENHYDKKVELFCQTCKREICMMCGITSHSSHDKVELKQVVQKLQLAGKEYRKQIKIKEEEWLNFKKFAEKSLDRIEQRFISVQQDVDKSAKKSMMEIETARQHREDEIRRDAQVKIKEIEEFMGKQLECNNIEAQNDEKRVEDSKGFIIKKLSLLRDAAADKTTAVTGAVAEKTSMISSVLDGRGMAEHDCQATVAEDVTRERTIADNIPPPDQTMKALEELGLHVDQVAWIPDHKDTLRDENLVSTIWTLKHDYNLENEPLPCSHVGGDTLIYIDLASGSVFAMDIHNGKSRPISQTNNNYTDCFLMGQDIFACGTIAKESQYVAHLSQLDLDKPVKVKTTIALNHRTAEPVAIYAAVNKKGVMMVGYDGSDRIVKVTVHSGEQGNILQKMIELKGKKVRGKLHATPGGKFVIDTGPSEFTVINEYGYVSSTICHKEWGFGLCGTDPVDDILYVSYRKNGTDIVRMDEVALDGTIRRKGVVEYKTNGKTFHGPGVVEYKSNGMFSEPILTSTGLLAIRNGQNIRIYERTPFTTVLSSLNMALSS